MTNDEKFRSTIDIARFIVDRLLLKKKKILGNHHTIRTQIIEFNIKFHQDNELNLITTFII